MARSPRPPGVADANTAFDTTAAVWTPHRPKRAWEKLEGGRRFKLVSDYEPAGDQPTAIAELVEGLKGREQDQVLLGVTGSGKTFTMAKVIESVQRPALILAPNKTLAAQLYGEMRQFFPENAVEYFVSYYDYYQPEAYVPRTDTYIEKESNINEQIDRMRHAATRAILERDDVIIVASVSCIYGIGSVETYTRMTFTVKVGDAFGQQELIRNLVALHYKRNEAGFARGMFRVRGDCIELWPAHLEDRAWRFSFFGDEIEGIDEFDPLTGRKTAPMSAVKVYANSHYVTPRMTLQQAVENIKVELDDRLAWFRAEGKLLEAQRLEQRCNFDMEMMLATGSCAGIENYSRYLTGRRPGEPPPTLFEYIPDNALVFTDESHVTIPQLGAMYKGDFSRKHTLSEYGFRLPSCMDNRPLKFEEWDRMRPETIHVSATPGPWELERTGGVFAEQVIRPTGLIDPPVEVRPVQAHGHSQVDDVIAEVKDVAKKGYRSLVTVLTKRMAEDLTEYMHEQGVRVRYMHSDIDTVERIEIIRDLRLGTFDVLVGINLLREGLDIPECGLVAILDADKEGFLRSETSLVQTIGRAAATWTAKSSSTPTASPARWSAPWPKPRAGARSRPPSISNTASRRKASRATSRTSSTASTKKTASRSTRAIRWRGSAAPGRPDRRRPRPRAKGACREGTPPSSATTSKHYIAELEKEMREAAADLEFETAARLRDEIKRLQETELFIADDPLARQEAVREAAETAVRASARRRARYADGRDGAQEQAAVSRTATEGTLGELAAI